MNLEKRLTLNQNTDTRFHEPYVDCMDELCRPVKCIFDRAASLQIKNFCKTDSPDHHKAKYVDLPAKVLYQPRRIP